jgi:hypothetical protein
MAPLVVEYEGYSAGIIIGIVASVVLILWSVRRSDREDPTLMQEIDERVTADMVSK